jgi:hypothetical protein
MLRKEQEIILDTVFHFFPCLIRGEIRKITANDFCFSKIDI